MLLGEGCVVVQPKYPLCRIAVMFNPPGVVPPPGPLLPPPRGDAFTSFPHPGGFAITSSYKWLNTFNIVTPTKGSPSILLFRDEMISIYFGERRSKVDTNIIECRKSKLCKACYSLDMSKDFNIVS